MNRKIHYPHFDHKPHLHIFKVLVISANVLCLFTYIILRIIFYDMPFVLQEEMLILLNLIGWSTGIAVAVSFLLFAGEGLRFLIANRKQFKLHSRVQMPEALSKLHPGG